MGYWDGMRMLRYYFLYGCSSGNETWVYVCGIVYYGSYVKNVTRTAFVPLCVTDLDIWHAKRNYNSYICTMHTLCGIIYHRFLLFYLHLLLLFIPSSYQIPGTIANFFALYFPPSSFLYLRSFFFAQSAICPTAIAINSAVLQCLFTSKIAIQAIL